MSSHPSAARVANRYLAANDTFRDLQDLYGKVRDALNKKGVLGNKKKVKLLPIEEGDTEVVVWSSKENYTTIEEALQEKGLRPESDMRNGLLRMNLFR
jgi:hypothetical protein